MTEGETGVNSRHDVLGLDKDEGASRLYFRTSVDSVLSEWGFVAGKTEFSADNDMVWVCYEGAGNQRIGAGFLGDDVGDSMKYNFISGGVVDRYLVDSDETADSALVFHNLPEDLVARISADLEDRLLE